MDNNVEKSLRRFIKNKITYTKSLLILFLITGSFSLASQIDSASMDSSRETLLAEIHEQKQEILERIRENETRLRALQKDEYELIRKADFYSKPIYCYCIDTLHDWDHSPNKHSTQIFFPITWEHSGHMRNRTGKEWKATLDAIKDYYANKGQYITDDEAKDILKRGNGVFLGGDRFVSVEKVEKGIMANIAGIDTVAKDIYREGPSVSMPEISQIPGSSIGTLTPPPVSTPAAAPDYTFTMPTAGITTIAPLNASASVTEPAAYSNLAVNNTPYVATTDRDLPVPETPNVPIVAPVSVVINDINSQSARNSNEIFVFNDHISNANNRFDTAMFAHTSVLSNDMSVMRSGVRGAEDFSYKYDNLVVKNTSGFTSNEGLGIANGATTAPMSSGGVYNNLIHQTPGAGDGSLFAIFKTVGGAWLFEDFTIPETRPSGLAPFTYSNGDYIVGRAMESVTEPLGEFAHIDIHGPKADANLVAAITAGPGAASQAMNSYVYARDNLANTNSFAGVNPTGGYLLYSNSGNVILEGGNQSFTNQYSHMKDSLATNVADVVAIAANDGEITIQPYRDGTGTYAKYNAVFLHSYESWIGAHHVMYNSDTGKVNVYTPDSVGYLINNRYSVGVGTPQAKQYRITAANRNEFQMYGNNNVGVYVKTFQNGNYGGVQDSNLILSFAERGNNKNNAITSTNPIKMFGDNNVGLLVLSNSLGGNNINAKITGDFYVDLGAAGVANTSFTQTKTQGTLITGYDGENTNLAAIDDSIGIFGGKNISLTSHGINIYDTNDGSIGVIAIENAVLDLGYGEIKIDGGKNNIGIVNSEISVNGVNKTGGDITTAGNIIMDGGSGNMAIKTYDYPVKVITSTDPNAGGQTGKVYIGQTTPVEDTVAIYAEQLFGSINFDPNIDTRIHLKVGANAANTDTVGIMANIFGRFTAQRSALPSAVTSTIAGNTANVSSYNTVVPNVFIDGNGIGEGIGLFSNKAAMIDFQNSYIKVTDGMSAVVAIDNSSKIDVRNSVIDYSGNGFAVYTKGATSNIDIRGSEIIVRGNGIGVDSLSHLTTDANSHIVMMTNTGAAFGVIDVGLTGISTLQADTTIAGLTVYDGTDGVNTYSDYLMALIDGGAINIDIPLTKGATTGPSNYYYDKIFAKRILYSANADVTAQLNSTQAAKYQNQVIALELNSSERALSSSENGVIFIGNRTLTADRTDTGQGAVGIYVNNGLVLSTVGSNVVINVETVGHNKNAVGIYALNGSQVNINGATINMGGDENFGIVAKSYRTLQDGTSAGAEYGAANTTQGSMYVANTGDIIALGKGSIGIYGDAVGTPPSNQVINGIPGVIRVGDRSDDYNSVGIFTTGAVNVVNRGAIVTGKEGIGIYMVNNGIINNLPGYGVYDLDSKGIAMVLDKSITIVPGPVGQFLTPISVVGGTEQIGLYHKSTVTGTKESYLGLPALTMNIDMSSLDGSKALYVKDLGDYVYSGVIRAGKNGVGVFADNSDVTSTGTININASKTDAVGMYTENGTVTNAAGGQINVIGDGSVAMAAKGAGNTITSTGNIVLDAANTVGMYIKDGAQAIFNTAVVQGLTSHESSIIAVDNSNYTINDTDHKVDMDNTYKNIAVFGKNGANIDFLQTLFATVIVDGNGILSADRNMGVYLDGTTTANTYDGTKVLGGNLLPSIVATGASIGLYSKGNNDITIGAISATEDNTIGMVIDGGAMIRGGTPAGSPSMSYILSSNTTNTANAVGIYAMSGDVSLNGDLTLKTGSAAQAFGTGAYMTNGSRFTGAGLYLSNEGSGDNIGIIYDKGTAASQVVNETDLNAVSTGGNMASIYTKGGIDLKNNGNMTLNGTSANKVIGAMVDEGSKYTNSGTTTLTPEGSYGVYAIDGEASNESTITMVSGSEIGSNKSIGMVANAAIGKISKIVNSGMIALENLGKEAYGMVVDGTAGTAVGENTGTLSVADGIAAYVKGPNASFTNTGNMVSTGMGTALALDTVGPGKISNAGAFTTASQGIGVYSKDSTIDFNVKLSSGSNGGTAVYADQNTVLSANIDASDSQDTIGLYIADGSINVTGTTINTGISNNYSPVGVYVGIPVYSMQNITVNTKTGSIGTYVPPATLLNYSANTVTNVVGGAVGVYVNGGFMDNNAGTINIQDNGIGVYLNNGGTVNLGVTGPLNVNFTGTGGILAYNGGGTLNIGANISVTGSGLISVTGNNDLSNSGILTLTGDVVGLLGIFDPSGIGPYTVSNTATGSIASAGGAIGMVAVGTGPSVTMINNGYMSASDPRSAAIYTNMADIQSSGSIDVQNDAVGIYAAGTSNISDVGNITVASGGTGVVAEGDQVTGTGITGTVTVGSGSAGKYTVGNYYKDTSSALDIPNTVQNGSYSVGTVLENNGSMITKIQNSIVLGVAGATKQVGTAIKGLVDLTVNNITIDNNDNIGVYSDGGTVSANSLNVGNSSSPDHSVSSVGIVAKNGQASIGTSTIGDDSVGVLAEASNVISTGIISLGKNAVGIFARNGSNITTSGNISTGTDKSVGIYAKDSNVNATNDISVGTDNSVGIVSDGTGNVTYTGTMNIADKNNSGSIGIQKIGSVGNIVLNGMISVGKYGYGVLAKNADTLSKVIVNNISNITTDEAAVGIYAKGNVTADNAGSITVGPSYLGAAPPADHSNDTEHLNSVGVYVSDGATGTNNGTITAANDHSIGVYAIGAGTEYVNNGVINVDNGGRGMLATQNAKVINNGTINVGYGIPSCLGYSIGMGAYQGGTVENNGTVTVGEGVGIYVGSGAKLVTNAGSNIIIANGIGIKGTGTFINNGGTVTVTGTGVQEERDGNSDIDMGAISITSDGTVYINGQYVGAGGTLIAENVISDGAYISVAKGTDTPIFDVKSITGEVKLLPDFIKLGNGYLWTIDNFVSAAAQRGGLTVSTSPLFVAHQTSQGGLVVVKQPYSSLTIGPQFDELHDGLDSLLTKDQAGTSKDSEILKDMNAYLENVYDTQGDAEFEIETARMLAETRGDIYATTQKRMENVQHAYDNSFDEMQNSFNFTRDTDKYSVIYTKGDYKDDTVGIDDYDYDVYGLMYMNEVESRNYNSKHGYSLGFTVSKFKFDDSYRDSTRSKEDIYSVRAGMHNVHSFSEDEWDKTRLITRLEVGYNRHEAKRRIELDETYTNKAHYNTFVGTFDNKLVHNVSRNYDHNLDIYAAVNAEYGYLQGFSEKGDGLHLKVKDNDYFSVQPEVGVQGHVRGHLGQKHSVKLYGNLAYAYELGENYDVNKAKVKNGTTDYYDLIQPEKEKGIIKGKVGVTLEKANNYGVSFEVEGRKHQNKKDMDLLYSLRFNVKY